jgi:hypothetical protein
MPGAGPCDNRAHSVRLGMPVQVFEPRDDKVAHARIQVMNGWDAESRLAGARKPLQIRRSDGRTFLQAAARRRTLRVRGTPDGWGIEGRKAGSPHRGAWRATLFPSVSRKMAMNPGSPMSVFGINTSPPARGMRSRQASSFPEAFR